MPMTCPVCNCEITLPALTVEFGAKDRALYSGHSIPMAPREAESTAVIVNKQGGFASLNELMRGMYGQRWVDYEPENVSQIVSRARHKLRTVGLEIISANKIGYALRLKDGCDCARGVIVSKAGQGQHKNRPVRQWSDERLRSVARMMVRGHGRSAIGTALGVSKGTLDGAIQRHKQRIAELRAHEARIAMGDRPRDVLRVPVEARLERG